MKKGILIMDGQGGQLGAQLVKAVLQRFPEENITAVGTNAIASAAMLKAGAHQAASGENPVLVASRHAKVIIGPVGIVIADAMYGEVTPVMAAAVGSADAVRILIPMNRCENLIAGVQDLSLGTLIRDAMNKLESVLKDE